MSDYPIPKDESWDILDSTKIKCFMDCNRKFMWEYLFGWRSDRPSNDLVFGAAWAVAMEHLRLNGYNADSIVDAHEAFTRHYRNEVPEGLDSILDSPKNPDNALLALMDYTNQFHDDFTKYKFLYTEISGTVPINESQVLHFRMDSIAEQLSDGRKIVIDDKTTGGQFGRQWFQQWSGSVQMNTYVHALYCLFPMEEVRGGRIRGARFLKTKREFIEHPIDRTPSMMQQYLWNVNEWVHQIKYQLGCLTECRPEDDVLMAFPQNPEACSKYWGCQYIDLCFTWPNPLRKYDAIPSGFKQEFWDPRKRPSTHKMELEWKQ